MPLVKGPRLCAEPGSPAQKDPKDGLKDRRELPNRVHGAGEYHDFAAHEPVVVILLLQDAHRAKDDEKVKGVQRIDVVEDECVAEQEAEPKDEKVQPPQHLEHAHDPEVALDVEKRQVAKAGHPDVARDEAAHGVVDGHLVKVVVGEEEVLHPTLPLLGLSAIKEGVSPPLLSVAVTLAVVGTFGAFGGWRVGGRVGWPSDTVCRRVPLRFFVGFFASLIFDDVAEREQHEQGEHAPEQERVRKARAVSDRRALLAEPGVPPAARRARPKNPRQR